MPRSNKVHAPWVVFGGKDGELGHCTRCGDGLILSMPQPIPIVVAASKAFVKIHSRCQDTGRREPVATSPIEWLKGRDTGASSATIWTVMTGLPVPYQPNVPRDPDDFGRCFRLLALFPQWRPRLPEVAAKYPEWKPFVDAWDQLKAMFENALSSSSSDRGREMYEFMKELRK
jgi:hypothetical protein